MKFETLLLRSLFVACLLVCGLILGAMINSRSTAVSLASHGSFGTLLLAAPASCTLPPDGVVCPRRES
ncbi:hypothetical protein ASG87_17470 [Frateuria sp. Soil773]|uniref:hypothetical protein n=1 Tax=Frateuria sp. Soil773 TaxID=1736407 RepID=UPI0006F5A1D2|nr:hypothetical protein [Frateuria sp. Soil773]KRE94499.1 hypothetical protein ASG87_17470 [Frateuria sp. Soil773]